MEGRIYRAGEEKDAMKDADHAVTGEVDGWMGDKEKENTWP